MMKALLFVLFGFVVAQPSVVDLMAAGAVGNNAALANAKGTGDKVTGSAQIAVTETTSSASATVTATSHPTPTPTPHPTPVPYPHPHPTPKPMKVKPAPKPAHNVIVKKADKVYKPVCGDLKNAGCGDIEKYDHCGFCLVDKYPTVGSGCTYSKQMTKKEGKKGEYEVVLVPDCECDGKFILEAKVCPTCDDALEELLKCAGAKDDKVVEIPEGCLKEVGVTVEFLVDCGYLKAKEDEHVVVTEHVKQQKKEHPKIVIKYIKEKKQDPKVMSIKKEKDPKHPIHVPSASAIASATAVGKGASASASASASTSNN
eukprot:TRINITY_DN249_c0_g1_i11.p2 TRINITY_DN249_c0_g1~~TRINITY_DN249_c0_g1_i11.p2  ORF type:complete len:314 (-),score=82.52 TRINITY_DN249_c0_g1_i11:506-1447(-)